jgi:hypothetical protein
MTSTAFERTSGPLRASLAGLAAAWQSAKGTQTSTAATKALPHPVITF